MNRKGFVMKRIIIVTIGCVLSAEAALTPLPGTKPLQWPQEHLSERLTDGAHSFIEGQIKQARAKRAKFWQDDSSVGDNRRRLREIIWLRACYPRAGEPGQSRYG
jgi:hypothetical protein